ncbi:MAG: Asp-tRNA(Asn)/Glu-tRNA(Gln) amidotransferase subunit GatC [Cyclobacteriaceae bacterium]|jgi:aspartyl-tRNA(Asn)/glutamyl-tRNA(Gln) amidotransferase subunit C|nr:Asp-tRNA(Asn)/Glu-tRNA(Gln) amidotransferase subunit GatC [Cyclobacteriaceae bacterium]
MSLDKQTLHKLAHLARLEVKPEEEAGMVKDLSQMLSFVEKLREVDTAGVEPLTSMTHEVNQLREDEPAHMLPREKGLQHAPRHDGTYFRVPKVIE